MTSQMALKFGKCSKFDAPNNVTNLMIRDPFPSYMYARPCSFLFTSIIAKYVVYRLRDVRIF